MSTLQIETEAIKLCKDCRWYKKDASGTNNREWDQCRFGDTYCEVRGIWYPRYKYCHLQRNRSGPCGPMAENFEMMERVVTPPQALALPAPVIQSKPEPAPVERLGIFAKIKHAFS